MEDWIKNYDGSYVNFKTLGNVLDLINRLQAENERLLQKTQRPQDADPMDFCGVLCDFSEELIKKTKSEARKEFAERLENEIFGVYYSSSLYHVVDIDDVNNLLKEMESEDNG